MHVKKTTSVKRRFWELIKSNLLSFVLMGAYKIKNYAWMNKNYVKIQRERERERESSLGFLTMPYTHYLPLLLLAELLFYF